MSYQLSEIPLSSSFTDLRGWGHSHDDCEKTQIG